MKTGADETTTKLRIRVVLPPAKYLYSQFVTGGRNFNVNRLLVALEEDTKPPTHVDWLNPYSDLTYEIASAPVFANTSYAQNNGDPLSDQLAGMVEVTVYYHEPGGIPYKDTFLIICDSDSSTTYTNIPSNHYVTVANDGEFLTKVNNTGGGAIPNDNGTYVIILTGSFNIQSSWVINDERASSLFIFVAANPLGGMVAGVPTGNPDVRIGRPGVGGANEFVRCQFTQTGFYFGKWPFNQPLVVSGTDYARREDIIVSAPLPPPYGGGAYPTFRYSSWEYVINANGPISEIYPVVDGYDASSTPKATPFIRYFRDPPQGKMYRITLDEKVVTVVPATGAWFK
jgi:hypothetical protein